MDNRDNFYFNKILLPFPLCCFILQSNHLSEPDNLSKVSQVLEKNQQNLAIRLTLRVSFFNKIHDQIPKSERIRERTLLMGY